MHPTADTPPVINLGGAARRVIGGVGLPLEIFASESYDKTACELTWIQVQGANHQVGL